MPNNRSGLQKQVSAIFDGVPIPENTNIQQVDNTQQSEAANCLSPSHLTATIKPQQSVESAPKPAQPKEPKARISSKSPIQKSLEQIWGQIHDRLFAPRPGVNSTKQKAMAIFVPILFIVFIIMISRLFSTSPRKCAATPQAAATHAAISNVFTNNSVWKAPEPWPATSRDPMQAGSSPVSESGITNRPVIKGIVYSDDNPSAIIGSKIAHQGEKVSGATVVKINKDSVEFEMNGEKWIQEIQSR